MAPARSSVRSPSPELARGRAAHRDVAAAPVAGGPEWPLWSCIILFVGSGCSALIHELVWFQLLELVVGSSAISLGILLGTFMGGLGLGSVLLPRIIPRSYHPFRVYALLELGVAALGILVFVGVPLVGHIYTGSGTSGFWGILLRAAIAGACLLPPTTLMGATLPAIARWVEATPRGVSWLGTLYGGNIAGGILGSLLAGFYLLRVYDMAVAMWVAVAINVGVGVMGLEVARRTAHDAPAPDSGGGRATGSAGTVYLAIGISGLCALGGQIVWTRILALLLGATVYTFSIILAVYLFGLGIGSGVGSVIARLSAHPRRDLALCQVGLAAAIAWSAFMVSASLPYWPIDLALARSPWITFQLDLARCLWAILPATILWGASFPLALAAVAARSQDPGRLVAGVYAANTIGAIAGAVGFTFVLVPFFGTRTAQQAMVGLSAAVGLLLLAPMVWPPWRSPIAGVRAAALASAAALTVTLVSSVPPVPSALIALGRYVVFRLGVQDVPKDVRRDPNILYVGEGLTQSVVVSQSKGIRIFHVSGKIEASTSEMDMRLQRLLGHLPALVHREPRSVLVVGCGTGVTAGAFVLHPSIERIVVCDIEPLVPQKVSPFFRDENHGLLSDPRVEVVYDDARHYILTTRERFDIITSDPIHPWVKGSAALYSRDYFDLVKRRLNPGGVVSQWVPLYQASEATVKGEMATFFSAFPNGTVWANGDRGQDIDLVMLGTDGPTTIDLDHLDQRLRRPDQLAVARSLGAVGFRSTIDLLSTYAGRRADLEPWLAGAEVNRDRKLWLQYQAGLESYTVQKADVYRAIAAYRRFPDDLFVGSADLKERLKGGGDVGTPLTTSPSPRDTGPIGDR